MVCHHTTTEKLLAEIEQSENPLTHKLWGNPVFSVTTGQLSSPLTSIDSVLLTNSAKILFQNVKTFIFTQIPGAKAQNFIFHVNLMQDIIGACFGKMALQDEAYCQVLREITGHQVSSWQPAQVSYKRLMWSSGDVELIPLGSVFVFSTQCSEE